MESYWKISNKLITKATVKTIYTFILSFKKSHIFLSFKRFLQGFKMSTQFSIFILIFAFLIYFIPRIPYAYTHYQSKPKKLTALWIFCIEFHYNHHNLMTLPRYMHCSCSNPLDVLVFKLKKFRYSLFAFVLPTFAFLATLKL